jgi:hypothetical protein
VRVRSASMVVAAAALTIATATGCSPSREEPSTLTGSPTSATTAEPTAETTTEATATTGEQPTTGAPQPNQQVISVTVTNGTVNPAPAPVDVKLGSVVVIEVTSDVDDEVHVHGYDILQPVTAGQPSRVEVQANVPGQFEVELEGAHLLLVQLRVQ